MPNRRNVPANLLRLFLNCLLCMSLFGIMSWVSAAPIINATVSPTSGTVPYGGRMNVIASGTTRGSTSYEAVYQLDLMEGATVLASMSREVDYDQEDRTANTTWSFNLAASIPPGSHTLYLRARSVRFSSGMAANSGNFTVTVNEDPPVNSAQGVQTNTVIPTSVEAGTSFPYEVVMRNSGTTTWVVGGANPYRLGSQNPADNSTWGTSRIGIPNDVAPGGQVAIRGNMTAPIAAGSYNFQWRMVSESAQWFGDFTPNAVINVIQTKPSLSFSAPGATSCTATNNSCTVTFSGNGSAVSGFSMSSLELYEGSTRFGLGTNAVNGSIVLNGIGNHTIELRGTDSRGVQNSIYKSFTVTAPVNSSQFVQTNTVVPTTLEAGTVFPYEVVMRNNGTTTWVVGGANPYRISSENPHGNTTWGTNRIGIPNDVAPGGQVAIRSNLTAPLTAGSYNLQWHMLSEGAEWFGEFTPNKVVNVTLTKPALSFTAPSTTSCTTSNNSCAVTFAGNGTAVSGFNMSSLELYEGTTRIGAGTTTVSGSATLTGAGNHTIELRGKDSRGVQNSIYMTFSVGVPAPTITVTRTPNPLTAGNNYTLSWSTTDATSLNFACTASGTGYAVNKSMATGGSVVETAQSSWVGYPSTCTWTATGAGGTKTYSETITTQAATNSAGFVSQTMPTSMTAGQQYNATVTMTNNGTTTWSANSTYKLGTQNPQDNTTWTGSNRVNLPTSVAPGQQYTFTIPVTAPAAGTYNFQWKMLQEGDGFFGAASTNVSVSVNPAVVATPINPPSKTLSRIIETQYESSTGLVSKQLVEPSNAQLRVETSFAYDQWGNVVSQTLSSPATGTAAITSRSQSATFDSRGQYAIGFKNALNQSESSIVDARWGKPAVATDANSLRSEWQYDGFGRKILEKRPDGTQTQWKYLLCTSVQSGTVTCPGYARFVVIATPYAADGSTQNGPWLKTYFDANGREVRRETQGFDGASIVTISKEYNSRGLLYRSSRPYYSSQTPQWTTYAYDAASRLVSETAADGGITVLDYSGLSMSKTNALNQRTTFLRDSLGQVTRITDNLGKAISYAYDAFGNVWKTTDPSGNTVLNEFDILGRKLRRSDPDLGQWKYEYDVLGQQVKETDAKGQVTSITYDLLGRMTTRAENDLVTTWTYDTCNMGVGKLCRASSDNGFVSVSSFDSLSRPINVATTIDSTYSTSVTFDANSRVATRTYPAGLVIKNVYNSLGYLTEVRDNATNALYWRADARDAEGHLTQQTFGNIATQQVFDSATGMLKHVYAGPGNVIQNLTFAFDKVGNLVSRADSNFSLSETFLYDGLNRLTSSTVNSNVGVSTQTYGYDDLGNVISRSNLGTYTYGGVNKLPHAVASIVLQGGGSRSYVYDANGNLTDEVQKDSAGNIVGAAGRTLTYTSFNMPGTIAKPGFSSAFQYGANHERVKQTGTDGTTIYVHPEVFGSMTYEKQTKSDGTVENREYIVIDGTLVAVKKSGTNAGVLYFHHDHLGSTTVVTDASGGVVERLAYEPFGKRRFSEGNIDNGNTIKGLNTNRGFTEQEHLDGLGLIHMNGRVYDPVTGRFMSADPTVPDASDLQSFNRYSYTRNNPLAATDPTGFEDKRLEDEYRGLNSLQSIFDKVASGIKGLFESISNWGSSQTTTVGATNRDSNSGAEPIQSVTIVGERPTNSGSSGGMSASGSLPLAVALNADVQAERRTALMDKSAGVLFGSSLGTAAGLALAGGCDTLTAGACALANPTIVISSASLGGAIGSEVVPPFLASSRVLAKNIAKATGLTKTKYAASHHIVAEGDPRAATSRAILASVGMNIDDAFNGINMSARYHDAIHTNLYHATVENALTGATTYNDVAARLTVIKTQIYMGTFPF